MIGPRFPEMLWTSNYTGLCQLALCACLGYAFNTPGVRSLLFDSFYFLFVQRLKIHQRWEIKMFPGFPEPAYSPARACGFLDSQEYIRVLKKTSMYSSFPEFPLSFLVRFSLVPTISLPQVATMLSSCQWSFFFLKKKNVLGKILLAVSLFWLSSKVNLWKS